MTTTLPFRTVFASIALALTLVLSLAASGCGKIIQQDRAGLRAEEELETHTEKSAQGTTNAPRLASLHTDDLARYTDPIFGFSGRVPVHWRKVDLSRLSAPAEADGSVRVELNETYAIAFESELSGERDRFADYLMIEVLPGPLANQFLVEPQQAITVEVDGIPARLEMLNLDQFDVGGGTIDLSVFQLTLQFSDHSIVIYAIGEQREATRLYFVMKEFIRSFRLPVSSQQVGLLGL